MSDLEHLKKLVLIQKGIANDVMLDAPKGSSAWQQARGSVGAYETVEIYINNLLLESETK